jgi:predicted MFS family arabinose efflux permease
MAGMATGTAGMPFFVFGLFILPLTTEFHWTQTQLATALIVKAVAATLTLGIVGRWADRIGVRPVAIVSMALTAAATLGFVLLRPSITSFYLAWAILTAAGAGTSPTIWTRGVSGWFVRHRGLAIGLTLTGTGISSALVPLLIEAAIERGGWKLGYAAMAAVTGLIGLPMVIALFKEAPGAGQEPSPVTAIPPEDGSLSFAQAARSRHFWQLGLGMMLAGGVVTSAILYLVPLLTDGGLARGDAVRVTSIMGVAIVLGRLAVGTMLDAMSGPLVAVMCFCLCAAAFLALAIATPALPVIMICVLVIGLCAGAEVDLMTFLTAKYFGLRCYAEISGWLMVLFTIGSGVIPTAAAYVRDASGSYTLPLLAGTAVLVLSAGLFGTLGKYRF